MDERLTFEKNEDGTVNIGYEGPGTMEEFFQREQKAAEDAWNTMAPLLQQMGLFDALPLEEEE